MKVFFISKDAAWQKYRIEVLNELALSSGFKIEILTIGRLKSPVGNGENVTVKSFRSWFPESAKISFFPGAIAYVLRNTPDAVLAVNNASQLTEYLALIACRLFGIKFVWWTHAYDHIPHKSVSLNFVKRCYSLWFLRLGSQIMTFSQSGKEYLVEHGFDSTRIFVVPNTLDTNKLKRTREFIRKKYAISTLRKEMGFDANDFILLYTGRMYKEKRLEDALLAFELARNSDKRVKMVFVGEGTQRRLLEDMVRANNLDDCVTFKGAIYDDIEVGKWFYISDVYLAPGAVGLGIVHAFSFGLPILTEDQAGHGPEIQFLQPGFNGFVVRRSDVVGLAQKIISLRQNSLTLKEMSANAFYTAESLADIGNMVEQMRRAIVA